MRSHIVTTSTRVGLAGWLVFDFLNLVGVLHVEQDFSWLSMFVIVVCVWIGVEFLAMFLERHGLLTLPWYFYVLACIGVTWNAIDALTHTYMRIGWYDKLVHGLAAMAVASIFYYVFGQMHKSGKIFVPPRTLGFFAFVVTVTVCVLYKFLEYFDTKLFNDGRIGQGVVGGLNTDNNFLLNVLGAALFTYIAVRVSRKLDAKQAKP